MIEEMRQIILISYIIPVIFTSKTCFDENDLDSYTGEVAETVSGIKCQRWSSDFPHEHDTKMSDFYNNRFPKNYCRSPKQKGKERGKFMWCYTTNKSLDWERCNVPKCNSAAIPRIPEPPVTDTDNDSREDEYDDDETDSNAGTYVVICIPVIIGWIVICVLVYKRCRQANEFESNLRANGYTRQEFFAAARVHILSLQPGDRKKAYRDLIEQASKGPLLTPQEQCEVDRTGRKIPLTDLFRDRMRSGFAARAERSRTRVRHPAGDVDARLVSMPEIPPLLQPYSMGSTQSGFGSGHLNSQNNFNNNNITADRGPSQLALNGHHSHRSDHHNGLDTQTNSVNAPFLSPTQLEYTLVPSEGNGNPYNSLPPHLQPTEDQSRSPHRSRERRHNRSPRSHDHHHHHHHRHSNSSLRHQDPLSGGSNHSSPYNTLFPRDRDIDGRHSPMVVTIPAGATELPITLTDYGLIDSSDRDQSSADQLSSSVNKASADYAEPPPSYEDVTNGLYTPKI